MAAPANPIETEPIAIPSTLVWQCRHIADFLPREVHYLAEHARPVGHFMQTTKECLESWVHVGKVCPCDLALFLLVPIAIAALGAGFLLTRGQLLLQFFHVSLYGRLRL